MSDELRIQTPTVTTEGPIEPTTLEQAEWFHKGFASGATAHAVACGQSGLKSCNDTLRKVLDDQGWKTIETFENLTGWIIDGGGDEPQSQER